VQTATSDYLDGSPGHAPRPAPEFTVNQGDMRLEARHRYGSVIRGGCCLAALLGLILGASSPSRAQVRQRGADECPGPAPGQPARDPTAAELRCRHDVTGPGRFGLLSYLDVPAYQPDTPMPGTHLVGVRGHAAPLPGESYEQWEWRVLRTAYGEEANRVHRELELLDPMVAARILRFESALAAAGVAAVRLESWRSPVRQAFLFQQGRSRPGPLATATLTSWHSRVDDRGQPAGRAVDYRVAAAQLDRFHQIARSIGLTTFGADSNDPGHVFVPDPEPLPEQEVILLRLLPRVPVVTLATGLPVDRHPPPGGMTELQTAVREWIRFPFIPAPPPRLARAPRAAIVEPARPENAAGR
jgi:hypothetical protein